MAPKKSNTATFAPKEMVLAKMTGFPAWPSFVMPPEMIPEAIMKAKKKTTNMCVIFIPDGDFNWMNEKSLEPLTAEKLNLKISKIPKDKLKPRPKTKSGRTTNVAEALVAANNLDFDDFMDELNKNMQESSEEMDNDDDEIEENEIENEDEEIERDAAQDTHEDHENNNDNGKRPARHSKGESGDPSIEDTDRRKRRTRAETPLQSKRARNNKSGTELESKTDKSNSGIDLARSSLSGTELAGTELAGSDLTNTSNLVTSDLDKADERGKNGDSPRSMSEKDRQHQLWLCRIKLQRSLIQRNQPVTPKDPTQYPAPTVDELSVARIILNRLADFPVNVELLKETKIHKVLRCILKYEDLEYPDSFRLHEKCNELLEKWSQLIENLKQEKNRSRVGSQVPEDSEVSGIEVKKDFGKVEV